MNFEIPIVLFVFKREDKVLKIIERIRLIKPKKIYILSDYGRNEEEIEKVLKCRKSIERAINWECEVVKRYANNNIGVYGNIAEGALWVFSKEEKAIFLEDDNLPELSFFEFCRELLSRYEHDNRILWICGTNYLEEFEEPSGNSYFFSRNMMPCGWASWADKFKNIYDGKMHATNNQSVMKSIKSQYKYKPLYRQDLENWKEEKDRLYRYGRTSSWDYQMSLAMRVQNVFCIVPKKNQIRNIGADSESEHGGFDMSNVMTKRFCEINTSLIEFPLKHPSYVVENIDFERRTEKIICYPFLMRIKRYFSAWIKRRVGMNFDDSLKENILRRFK